MSFDIARLPGHETLVGLPSDVAFLAGSRQAGFSNPRSDYDLYLVYSEGLERLTRGTRPYVLEDGTRVDVACYARGYLEELAGRINRLRFEEPSGFRGLALDEVAMYYRVAIGETVFNPSGMEALRRGFDAGQGAVAFGGWSRGKAARALGEAADLVGRGAWAGAYVAARTALAAAVNAQTAAEGDGYPSEKLAFVKLARRHGRAGGRFRRAWRLKALGDRSLEDYVEAVLAYCAELGITPEPPVPEGARRLARSRAARRFTVGGEHYLVHFKTQVYALDDWGRFLWDALDGKRDVGEVAALAAAHGEPAGVRREVEEFTRRLRAEGLVSEAAGEAEPRPEGSDGGVPASPAAAGGWAAPTLRRLEESAAEFAVKRLTAARAVALFRAAAEDMLGGVESEQDGLVITACWQMLVRGAQARVALERGWLPAATDFVSALVAGPGFEGALAERAWALAAENPETESEAREHARRVLAFIADDLGVEPFAGWWEGAADDELDRKHWDTLGPLVLLARYLDVTPPGVTLDASLKIAEERNHGGRWMSD